MSRRSAKHVRGGHSAQLRQSLVDLRTQPVQQLPGRWIPGPGLLQVGHELGHPRPADRVRQMGAELGLGGERVDAAGHAEDVADQRRPVAGTAPAYGLGRRSRRPAARAA